MGAPSRYWARERPGAEFTVVDGRSVTYAAAASLANRVANRLTALGCKKGSRVAVLAKNTAWYPVMYFAAAKAGVVLLPVNWRLASAEWLDVLNDAQVSVLIVGREQLAGADEIRAELKSVEHFVAECEGDRGQWESLERWLSEGSTETPEVEVNPDDALYQMYTSGTTGAPKGAVLSHSAVTSNIVQVGLAHPVSAGDRGLVVLPMFHAAVIPAALSGDRLWSERRRGSRSVPRRAGRFKPALGGC
jgi:acyl-CoA synthetase (AMP-forming)/AMP-acid ligase II